jgi:hypothetical protein
LAGKTFLLDSPSDIDGDLVPQTEFTKPKIQQRPDSKLACNMNELLPGQLRIGYVR